MEKILRNKISEAIRTLFEGSFEVLLERPTEESHGDFSCSSAMNLSRELKRNPRETAEAIISAMGDIDGIDKIEIAGPGFINFYLSNQELIKNCEEIAKNGPVASLVVKDTKIVLEHTNANPNKALHLGHLRNACLGNSLERILEFMGADVEVQYYIDDTGVQVAQTALGFKKLQMNKKEDEKFDHFAARVYTNLSSRIEHDQQLQDELKVIIEGLDRHDPEISKSVKEIATRIVKDNLKTMSDYGIDYDLMVWESDIIGFGFWKKAFEILKGSASFKKMETGKNSGCYVVKNVMGEDKVIVKSDGVVTYTGKDIAYHLWKFNLLGSDFRYREWPNETQEKTLISTDMNGDESEKYGRANEVINIVDVRQSFPQQAVMESLRSLGYIDQASNFHHVGYGVVNLSPKTAEELGVDVSSGKSSYAMSGRKGIGVFADDLLSSVKDKVTQNHPDSPCINDVAIGAIKYYMLSYNAYSDIAFDFDRALDIYGNSGPYIQYTHARCKSVLEKMSNPAVDDVNIMDFGQEEQSILKHLYHYNEAVISSGQNYSPNILCNYLYELAKKFNHFYATCPVATCADADTRNLRVAICISSQKVIESGLDLLGIKAPNKM